MIRPNMESVGGTNTLATGTLVYGGDYSQDFDSQQPLATQLPPRFPSPARPSSRDSIRSQNDDEGEQSAPLSESQDGLSTQVNAINPQHRMSIAAITEPSAPNRIVDRKSLLEQLRPTSTKPQPLQVTSESSHRGANGGASASDFFAIQKYNDGKIETTRRDPSDGAELSSQRQATILGTPQPQTQPVQDTNASLKKQQQNPANPQPQSQEEVTSFQRIPTSPRVNTSPIAATTEIFSVNVETNTNIDNSRSTEITGTKTVSDRGPWDNITKLAQRDVTIPKEQEELLDRSDCWIPADVGQPIPQGHVPPALLKEWNAKMTRLFREKRANTPNKKPDSSPEREEVSTPTRAERLSEDESDSDSEDMEWSQSPDEHLRPARDRAPPDSPIRQQGKQRSTEVLEKYVNKVTHVVDETPSKNKSSGPLSTPSPSPITHPIDPTQETSVSKSGQTQNSTLSHAHHSTPGDPSNDTRLEGENVESSDGDEYMETSIPQPLTTSSQNIASQPASSESVAPGSSNPSSAPVTHIFDTPAAALKRVTHATGKFLGKLSRGYVSQQNSSDGNKSSSQVIANSVDSTENSSAPDRELEQSSSAGNKSSSQVIASSVGSTGNASAQDHEMENTQKPFVEDSQHTNGDSYHSSLPSHQDSQRVLEVVPDSSLNATDLHTQVYIRNDEALKDQTDSSSNPSTAVVPETTLKRKAQDLQQNDESPSKRPRQVVNEDIDITSTQITIHSGRENINKDGQKYTFSLAPIRPLTAFERFKNYYPDYPDDFDHFCNITRRLKSLCSRGMLSQHLWDDFVMRHLLDYRAYVQAQISGNKPWEENYEEWFCKEFTSPSFKQRSLNSSLNSRRLDAVAPKHQPLTRMVASIDNGTQTIIDNLASGSVTQQSQSTTDLENAGTLRNENLPSSASDTMSIVDKPPQANIGVKMTALTAPPTNSRPCMIDANVQVNPEDLILSFPERNERSEAVEVEDMIIDETQARANEDDDEEMAESESSGDSSMDKYHETASVELGVSEEGDNGDGIGDYDYDYDDDARIDLISRIQRENHKAVDALRSTAIPEPTQDARHLDESTPFRRWAQESEQLSLNKHRKRTAVKQEEEDDEEGSRSWNPFKRPGMRRRR